MDENMKKWPQTETGSQTGAFTLLHENCEYSRILVCVSCKKETNRKRFVTLCRKSSVCIRDSG